MEESSNALEDIGRLGESTWKWIGLDTFNLHIAPYNSKQSKFSELFYFLAEFVLMNCSKLLI